MAAYVVVEISIKDTARYERYKPLASASSAKFGAETQMLLVDARPFDPASA
jgi:uncharacterized protein (DUF1330 family)